MSYRVLPDRVNGRRIKLALVLLGVALVWVFGSLAWNTYGQPGGDGLSGPQAVSTYSSLALLGMAVPFLVFAHARLTWRYRCPRCRARIRWQPPGEPGTPVRHRCDTCRVAWDTGLVVAADPD